MSNFELIDDYLTNRLGDSEKLEFEQQLGADPLLRADVDLQKGILEGIKNARIADLKAMLNNIPVTGGLSHSVAGGKIAAAVATVGIIGTSLYFYVNSHNTNNLTPTTPEQSETKMVEPKRPATDSTLLISKTEKTAEPVKSIHAAKKTAISPNRNNAKKAEATQPRIETPDTPDELVDNSSSSGVSSNGQKSSVTLSRIAVETDASNKNYHFHYQFNNGKLTLFGVFDKSLYEILEIHGDRHAVFLYYKENYYLLKEKESAVIQLEPIRDATLIKKLKEYRGH